MSLDTSALSWSLGKEIPQKEDLLHHDLEQKTGHFAPWIGYPIINIHRIVSLPWDSLLPSLARVPCLVLLTKRPLKVLASLD